MKNIVFGDWKITDKISDGSISSIYKAERTDGCFSAIKYISFPKDKEITDKIIKKGYANNYQDANNYLINIVNKEVEIMKRFNGNPYIVDCYDIYHEKTNNGKGMDFYIRMEHIEDIKAYYSKGLIDVDEVVKLGKDICSALDLCSSINFVHNDVKPENIFVGTEGNYKLGDFSAAYNINNIEKDNFGTLNYVAPEKYKDNIINESTDIYSLGILMYQLLNGKLPFISEEIDEKKAFDLRMSGKEIPSIKGANKKLMEVILKACAYNPKNRYQSANEMKKDLEVIPHIPSKKMKINFSTKKAYENTVDINDLKLIEKVNLENIKKNKLSFKEKYNIKAILISTIFVFIILFFSTSYVLNRNCPVGEVNKNGICVSGYYYCDTGYTLNEDKKCQKTIETIDAKTSYTCPSGYVLSDKEHCISEKQIEMSLTYECISNEYVLNEKEKKCELQTDAAVQYTCPSGYNAVGTNCVSVTTVNATSKWECEDPTYTLSGTTCKKNITKTENAEMSYTCNEGGTLNGSVCDYTTNPTNFWFGYGPKCSRGTYSSTDNMCHYSESARINMSCRQGGVLTINKCYYTIEDVKDAIVKYSCPSGYVVSGSSCAKTTDVKGTAKYACPDGTKIKGNKCIFTSDAVAVYKCPTGYVTTGVNCVAENIPVPVKKYSCSKVYTLNGDKCEKYDIIKAKTYYN